jgi:hypothetical protein
MLCLLMSPGIERRASRRRAALRMPQIVQQQAGRQYASRETSLVTASRLASLSFMSRCALRRRWRIPTCFRWVASSVIPIARYQWSR